MQFFLHDHDLQHSYASLEQWTYQFLGIRYLDMSAGDRLFSVARKKMRNSLSEEIGMNGTLFPLEQNTNPTSSGEASHDNNSRLVRPYMYKLNNFGRHSDNGAISSN